MPIGPLAYWPADTSASLDPRPIGEVLAARAASSPQRPAVVWAAAWPADRPLAITTYAELYDQATELARRLVLLSAPNRPVAVAAGSSADWLTLEYGAALAGVPLVPVNPAFTDDEIEHILTASQASVLLVDRQYRGSPLLERARIVASRTSVAVVDRLSAWRGLPRSDGPLPEVDAADAFLIQFTSGTTGRPKGAVLSHRAAYNCARLSMERLGGTSEDRWLNVLPMHHVGGSVSVALAVLAVGASVVLVPTFEPGLVLGLLESTGATIMGGVPTMQLALLDHQRFPSTDLGALRIVQSGGSAVPPSLIRRCEKCFGAAIVVGYGQSESPNAIQTNVSDDDLTKACTIGTPLPQREVRIVGTDGSVLSLDEVGELQMRSPMVMDRYIGSDAGVAAETLDDEGWLHTGDLCSMDERGVVSFHGRVRDVIIRGGENIYPAEVEDVLLRHPAVADVAVIGVADDHWGEVPVACYRTPQGAELDSVDLERYARARLASFKVPRRWVRLDAFPLTASGKVKKFELQAQLVCRS